MAYPCPIFFSLEVFDRPKSSFFLKKTKHSREYCIRNLENIQSGHISESFFFIIQSLPNYSHLISITQLYKHQQILPFLIIPYCSFQYRKSISIICIKNFYNLVLILLLLFIAVLTTLALPLCNSISQLPEKLKNIFQVLQ